ncbi:hypothetical protein SAMN02983003_3562 [Devosia enhydra]|uniref:Uncharacterized protein n=1 Tax=Devosia enhydra TaxID=665118 RepID=A0A1K2I1X3_9HYPH|nr:hypothetical protein [Devosia enhydra]SFZ86382.1 hypothetical protein SAMN02983003_3562 [Devosia enhydra]
MKAAFVCLGLMLASASSPVLAQNMSVPDGFTCTCWADIDQPMPMPGGGKSYICPPGPRTITENLPQRTFMRGGDTIIASCELPLGSPNDNPSTYDRGSSVSDGEEGGGRQR